MRRKQNSLIDLTNKFKFKIEGLGGEEFRNKKLVSVRLVLIKPKTRKHHPLFTAFRNLKKMAKVRQTPFRLQFTINQYFLVRHFLAYGIKNPIDEFVEITNVNRTIHQKTQTFYSVDVKIVDNMHIIKMMDQLHKIKKRSKKKRKAIKKKNIKHRKTR